MLLKSYTVAIEDTTKNNANQVDLNIIYSGKDIGSGVGLSTTSVATCHKCGRKGNIQKYLKPNGNDSGRDLS